MKKNDAKHPPDDVLCLRAPAKVNLALAVLGRRADGYHEIDTVMQAISLADELRVRAIDADVCRIRCRDARVPRDERNLIHRAWRRMRARFGGRVGGIAVELIKRIPTGAGLGGGSSDAAAALAAIDRLYGLRLGRGGLEQAAAEIGSDAAFFLRGGAARCRGRGEIVEPIRVAALRLHLVVVYPGFESSTAEAYGRLREADFGGGEAVDRVERALRSGDRRALFASAFNVFDRAAADDARYRELKTALAEAGVERPMLSGSGSACFGFAKGRRGAEAARRILAKTRPQTFAVKTIGSGVRKIFHHGDTENTE